MGDLSRIVKLDENIELKIKSKYRKISHKFSYDCYIFFKEMRIGCALISYTHRMSSDGEVAYIHDMKIDEKFRNKGLGTEVMNFILKNMKKEKVTLIFGELSKEDDKEISKRFWSNLGFTIIGDKIVKFIS